MKIANGLLQSAMGALFLVSGCSVGEDPKLAQLRSTLMLKSEPANAISLTEAKNTLAEESDIVLVGKIGSGKLSPFDPAKAAFVLSEAPLKHEEDEGHDASDCPFCKRRAAEAPIAFVELRNETDKAITVGAEKLLGLKDGQTVVIEGRGVYSTEEDSLQIVANKIFVRPSK